MSWVNAATPRRLSSLASDYYRYHLAYAEELASHPSIDPSRIAVYGQSFGGNPVAKLAVDHDDVFSAINSMNFVADLREVIDMPKYCKANGGPI